MIDDKISLEANELAEQCEECGCGNCMDCWVHYRRQELLNLIEQKIRRGRLLWEIERKKGRKAWAMRYSM